MTDDYKNLILKYLTGAIEDETPKINEPYFRDKILKETTLKEEIDIALNSSNWELKQINQAKDSLGNYNGISYLIIENLSYPTDGGIYTAIALVKIENNSIKLMQLISEYESGTKFQEIQYLGVAEDGKCFIAEYLTETTGDRNRLVLLNNLSVKSLISDEYKAKLRTAYNIEGNPAKVNKIIKSPISAEYIFVNGIVSNSILTLKINVGSENEWVDYGSVSGTILDVYATFSDDKIDMNVWQTNGISLEMYRNQDTQLVKEIDYSSISSYLPDEFLDVSIRVGNFYTYGDRKIYLSLYGSVENDDSTFDCGVIFFDVEGENITELYRTTMKVNADLPEYVTTFKEGFLINGLICEAIVSYEQKSPTSYGDEASIKFFMINKDTQVSNDETIVNIKSFDFIKNKLIFCLNNVYNLYSFSSIISGVENEEYNSSELSSKVIYNPLNINNRAYENKSALVPTTGNLYDEDNNLIFARNLYNNSVNENIITSVLQIPNTMLNDDVIKNKELLGKTNKSLIVQGNELSKNIYETLNINFITKFLIQNKNNIDNPINNLTGSVRLAQSSSKLVDYDNAKGVKIKINYEDNTFIIKQLNKDNITINNNLGTIKITLFVPSDKNVTTIEIKSNDEETIYQTISDMNLQKGKLYNIIQNIEVE